MERGTNKAHLVVTKAKISQKPPNSPLCWQFLGSSTWDTGIHEARSLNQPPGQGGKLLGREINKSVHRIHVENDCCGEWVSIYQLYFFSAVQFAILLQAMPRFPTHSPPLSELPCLTHQLLKDIIINTGPRGTFLLLVQPEFPPWEENIKIN